MTEQSEREAIVAWLRRESHELHKMAVKEADGGDDDFVSCCIHTSAAYARAAAEIERGDHLKGNSDER